jgi:DNA-directed RNA polymerase subunit RPC12/RpoP
MPEVDRQALLAAVVGEGRPGVPAVALAGAETSLFGAVGRLDFDDPGAHVRQQTPAVGSGDVFGDVENDDARQNGFHGSSLVRRIVPGASPSIGASVGTLWPRATFLGTSRRQTPPALSALIAAPRYRARSKRVTRSFCGEGLRDHQQDRTLLLAYYGRVVSPAVDVLRCPACGAHVALGQAADARCAHCGKAVPLPEAHRELRRIQHDDEAARRRAQALFFTLDSPPWLSTRILAAVFDQPMFAFWIFFGVPVGLASIVAGLAVDTRLHPPPAATVGVIFGFLFTFAFLPRSIGVYANRRAGGRSLLLSGLAARPPKLPGGPAGCRECGAPLEVAPGALVARCVYCGADSAVEIRTPFLARARRAARGAVHTIDQAAALDRRERAATRGTLARELGRYLLATSIFGGLFAIWTWDYARVTARGDDSAPALGLVALIVGTILLIVMMFRSIGSDKRGAEEARLRRDDNGLPGWVAVVGPLGLWVVLWLIRIAIWH